MSIREQPRQMKVIAAPPTTKLPISQISQKPMGNWCWVACAAMVLIYRDVSFGRMCCLPVFVLAVDPVDCCSGIGGGSCDKRASKETITNLYQSVFHIPVERVGKVSPQEIVDEINDPNSSPVQVGYKNSGFGLKPSGHVKLVFGHSNGTNFYVHDPLSDAEAVLTFEELSEPCDGGDWFVTWKALRRPPAGGEPHAC